MKASNFVKKMLGFFLFVALAAGFAPASALAYEGGDDLSSDGATTVEVVKVVNSFAQGEGEVDEALKVDSTSGSVSDVMADGVFCSDSAVEYVTYEQAIALLQEAMTNRETSVSFSMKTDDPYKYKALELLSAALEEDGISQHGDYLRCSLGIMSCQTRYRASGDAYLVTYAYTINYKTTAAQEQILAAKVDEALGDMRLDGKTEYEKVRAIYDYICTHVAYDYDHLGDSSYKLKQTAYAAMVDGRSVCEGYASLFYLMAGEAGLDARVISGTGNGGAHAWNIVRIDDEWYNVDATWDAAQLSCGLVYTYFLKSDADFSGHVRGGQGGMNSYDVDYGSDAFYAAHPMASKSWPTETGAWKKNSYGWWYQRSDGTYPAGCWEWVNGEWYYFDKYGFMETGWLSYGGAWYYLGSNGAMKTGWLWDGAWYFLDPANDGIMATGWILDGGSWYYMDGSGIMQTGWLNLGGKWRYLSSGGAMQTGWLWDGGAWYYLNPDNDGIMATGWVLDDGDWYYLFSSGIMARSCWVGDYYLLDNGRMATSQWVDGWYVGTDGKWVPGYKEA